MASGGKPPNGEEKWVPPVGKPQMDAREEEEKKGHSENRKGKTTKRINVETHDHLMFLKKLKFKDFFMQKHQVLMGNLDMIKTTPYFIL